MSPGDFLRTVALAGPPGTAESGALATRKRHDPRDPGPSLPSAGGPAQLRCRQRGFSLLETLVAFSVLAICLGVMLRVFGGGGRAAVLTDGYARATTIAESFLAALGTEKDLQLGRQEGLLAGGYRWIVQVAPLPVQMERISALNFSFLPYWVEVTVTWGDDDRRQVKLSTVRLISNGTSGPGPAGPGPGPGRSLSGPEGSRGQGGASRFDGRGPEVND